MTPAQDKIRAWREDPVLFVREVFGVEPDWWQADGLRAFPWAKRLAAKACKGPGKTAWDAWLAWNFLLTRPHPKIAATSISGDNLRDGLWSEMAKWRHRSPLLRQAFEWTQTRIFAREHPETWFMSARQWSKSADPGAQADTLAGFHGDYLLFLIDEAGGVPDSVAAAAEAGLATGIETKLVLTGNPTLLSGPLYRACTSERHLYAAPHGFLLEITGDPDDPKRAPRIDVQWARDQIAKYGRDNPWVLVNVFGQFPPSQSNALLGVEEVGEAMRRAAPPELVGHEAKILGVDVARFGDDRSVAFMRQGRRAFPPQVWRGLDLMTLAAQVAEIIETRAPHAVFIDQTGIGAGVVDRLYQLCYSVIGVDFGGKPLAPERFTNRRGEMWWTMADWVKAGGCLPDTPELVSELTGVTYDYQNAAGKFSLESKEELKKRGQPSPDLADALALTFAEPVAHPALRIGVAGGRNITVHRAFRG